LHSELTCSTDDYTVLWKVFKKIVWVVFLFGRHGGVWSEVGWPLEVGAGVEVEIYLTL
jgi:hypothetical protein